MQTKNIFKNFLILVNHLNQTPDGDSHFTSSNTSGNYMFKVNTKNTRLRCEIWSKLTIKTSERRLAYFTPRSSVSIVNFEQVNTGWDCDVGYC